MAPTKHDYIVAACQQLYAIPDVHRSPVRDTLLADQSGKINCHCGARIVVLVLAERPGQRAAVCCIDVARRVIGSTVWFTLEKSYSYR